MALVPFRPFLGWPDVDRLMEEFGRFPVPFDREGGFFPPADVYETKDAVIAELPLAGVDPDKVDISIENNVLTVKGESERKSEVEDKDYIRKEVRYGSFYRQLPLPTAVVGEKASAVAENGMLKISVPKAPEAKTKGVKVKVTKKLK